MPPAVRLTLGLLTQTERVKYFLLITARAIAGLLDVVGIALIAFVAAIASTQLSSSTGSGTVTTIAGITIPAVDRTGLLWLVLGVLVVFAAKSLIAVLLIRAQAHLVAAIEIRNAKRIARFLIMGSLAAAKSYSKADIQFAVTNSTTFAFTGLLNNFATLITESFLLIVITSTFLVVDFVTALFALAYFGLVIVVIQLFIGRRLKRAGREAVAGTIDTINTLSDTLDAFREISVLQKQKPFINRIEASRARVARSNATSTYLGGMPRYVIEAALMLGVVILVGQQVLFFGGSGLVTVGVFLAGGVRMMASLLPLQNALANMKQNAEQAETALDLLTTLRRVEEDPAATILLEGPNRAAPGEEVPLAVALNDVTYRYPVNATDTVHEVTLAVEPGQYAAIIGPSGAGKTTIVDLMLGLLAPDSGTVRIGDGTPEEIRAFAPGLIAYVPQKPGLVSGTIAQNIALGVDPDEVDEERLAEVVRAAFLEEFLASLPKGLQTSVGKQVDSLSGGQIQRIGLARALYSRPRFLILDEATSGLDAGSEAFIASSLARLHGEVTVVVIAHRLSTVQHADIVFVVEEGRISASGSFRTVVDRVPLVAEYVKLMSFDQHPVPESPATVDR